MPPGYNAGMAIQGASPTGTGLRVLSAVMGLFLVLMGTGKWGWLADPGFLIWQLEEWQALTSGASRWYLETVALPGAPVFARVVPLAEIAAGAALLAGFQVRLTATIALLMILNFHFASGIMFTAGYLTNGYGPPVLGGLLALAIGGRTLPFSLTR